MKFLNTVVLAATVGTFVGGAAGFAVHKLAPVEEPQCGCVERCDCQPKCLCTLKSQLPPVPSCCSQKLPKE